MENQLKDEQILRQSEEIESQRRKIENLEAELQKFLSTDSGEINPSLHGESSLLAKVNALQLQLDDCLDSEDVWIKDEPFKSMICNNIAAQFMPIQKYNDHHKKWFAEKPYDLWFLFRSAIFDGPECAGLLQSQAFRDVIWTMHNFIDDIVRESANFDLFTSSAEVILDNTTAEGWALLAEALTLEQNSDAKFAEKEDHQWIRMMILNIHRFVKMYHEAKEPVNAVAH